MSSSELQEERKTRSMQEKEKDGRNEEGERKKVENKKEEKIEDGKKEEGGKLWGGRFKSGLDPRMEHFNASIHFDRRLWKEDILASIEYANCLKQVNLLKDDECWKIVEGLKKIHLEWQKDSFSLKDGDEDIHSANERRLKEIVGIELGGKLHTGRSRNDQVATDTRLWLRTQIDGLQILLKQLIATMVRVAEENLKVIVPGYTHMQRAQAILLPHWLLSYAWMLVQDGERLLETRSRVNVCPLGSGAIAGNPFPVDRHKLAKSLSFQETSCNSIQAVSDRDFVAEFLFWSSLTAVHLSRLSEDLIIYSSKEFSFLSMSDAFSTGSSLMPQKKNADACELIRGKTGRLIGHSTGFLIVMKGLPSSFNKDLQEDKEALFDSVDSISEMLQVMEGVVGSFQVRVDECRAALSDDLLATDVAYWLVRRGMSFREAHEISGRVVARAEQLGCQISQVPLNDLLSISNKFNEDIHSIWNHETSIEQYDAKGGTSSKSVQEQILLLKQWLEK